MEPRKYKQTSRRYLTREIARGVARKNMKRQGFTRFTKKERSCLSPRDKKKLGSCKVVLGRSTFSNQWRLYAMAH